jgi:hypothetical protein
MGNYYFGFLEKPTGFFPGSLDFFQCHDGLTSAVRNCSNILYEFICHCEASWPQQSPFSYHIVFTNFSISFRYGADG